MKKNMNKTNNHSERNRIAQNDRYHFTDDLYYQGKRYGKNGRQQLYHHIKL